MSKNGTIRRMFLLLHILTLQISWLLANIFVF